MRNTKKFLFVIFTILAFLTVSACKKTQTVIHCYEYSAAYDYAVDNGTEPFIIFGAKQPDFSCDENKFEYSENENSYEIMKYNGDGVAVYIPETHNGKPVTTINADAFKNVTVKDIYFPVTATEINCDLLY